MAFQGKGYICTDRPIAVVQAFLEPNASNTDVVSEKIGAKYVVLTIIHASASVGEAQTPANQFRASVEQVLERDP